MQHMILHSDAKKTYRNLKMQPVGGLYRYDSKRMFSGEKRLTLRRQNIF